MYRTNVPNYAFIPRELIIDGKPELKVFSFNIMFGQSGKQDNKWLWASAVYTPELNSFKENEENLSMRYKNQFGGNSYIDFIYSKASKNYRADKFVDDKWVGSGMGADWNSFFAHLTALGLSVGEMCQFRPLGL